MSLMDTEAIILFWNCRVIGDKIKKDFIKDQIDKNSLDFVGIQETIKVEFTSLELCGLSAREKFY